MVAAWLLRVVAACYVAAWLLRGCCVVAAWLLRGRCVMLMRACGVACVEFIAFGI